MKAMLKKYSASVGIRLSYDIGLYDSDFIEAENEEEAIELAKERAMEDVDVNGATFDYNDIDVYSVWEADDDED